MDAQTIRRAKRIGRKIGLNDEKGYGIAVFLALIVVVVVVAGFFVSAALNPPSGLQHHLFA